jgi:hypothetical protein
VKPQSHHGVGLAECGARVGRLQRREGQVFGQGFRFVAFFLTHPLQIQACD